MQGNKKLILSLEKALLSMLHQYALSPEVGDGKTEILNIDALKPALKHIQLFNEHSLNKTSLIKGINKNELHAFSRAKKIDYKYRNFISKQKNMNETLTLLHNNLNKISRVVAILIKYRYRLQYQYDITGPYLIFRIRKENLKHSTIINSIFELFYLSIKDYKGGFQYINRMAELIQKESIIQFTIDITIHKENSEIEVYFINQINLMLNTIPQRSPALFEDISIIDRQTF